eukprot:TRINITY_DN22372_c0_g1_i1.p1 TRINITY_DN22372_c0_g1~~TRINITY_DN22372_c0_g1_i1.p1  ORF type:complete len:132 (+),score=4.21 TRINITY_DN22372_c0_g1_i1:125-520(+)
MDHKFLRLNASNPTYRKLRGMYGRPKTRNPFPSSCSIYTSRLPTIVSAGEKPHPINPYKTSDAPLIAKSTYTQSHPLTLPLRKVHEASRKHMESYKLTFYHPKEATKSSVELKYAVESIDSGRAKSRTPFT